MAPSPQADSGASTPTPNEGEILQSEAYAEPPIVPEDLALALVITVLITAILATLIVGLRVYVRAWIGRKAKVFGWEDIFAILGYFAFLISSIFCIKASYYGLGTPDSKLNALLMIRCAEYMLYSQILYGFSMPLIKASIVLTLMRITTNKGYRWSLYGMQFIASVMALIGILASLLYCHPVQGYWNPYLGTCGDFMIVVNIGYAWTAVGIVTDWTCAILPYFIVRNLQMSARNKATVMFILGLGAVASVFTIVRAPYLQYYLVQTDRLYWNGYISLWCQLESGIGLIAACLPALRLLFKAYFDASNNRSKAYGAGSSFNSRNDHLSTPMDTLSRTTGRRTSIVGGKWQPLDDEDSSTKHIVQETTVTVETSSVTTSEVKKKYAM